MISPTYLKHLIAHATDGIILRHGEVALHIVVTQIGGICIAMLVRSPFEFCHIRMTSANILRLDIFPTLVEIEAVGSHLYSFVPVSATMEMERKLSKNAIIITQSLVLSV